MIDINDLWNKYKAGKLSQPDYELSYLNWLVMSQKEEFPETDENFLPLFEGIILKLADMYPLKDHEWESIQRLYFLRTGTIMLEDIITAFGYKYAETLE